MAYDEVLADRVRARLTGVAGVSEKRMFGGLAFLVEGKLAVAVSGQGGLMVRVDPADGERLLATTDATAMEMRGRPMSGWLRVAAEVDGERDLSAWVDRGAATARRLAGVEG